MKGKKESYLYQFEGYDYQYAITKDQQEKVFRMTPAKRTVEVLNGVGKYTILGEADKPLYTTDKMKDYTVDESGKNPVVTVHYALSDNAGDVTAIYTLYKEYMDVEISLENYSGKDAASAYYVREFTKKYQKVEKRSVGTWKFPENDDFPYQTFDSLAWIHRFKDGGSMYTFYEGEEAQPKNYLEAYPEHAIPLTMSDDKQPQDKLHLALVFSTKRHQNSRQSCFVCEKEFGHGTFVSMYYEGNRKCDSLYTEGFEFFNGSGKSDGSEERRRSVLSDLRI